MANKNGPNSKSFNVKQFCTAKYINAEVSQVASRNNHDFIGTLPLYTFQVPFNTFIFATFNCPLQNMVMVNRISISFVIAGKPITWMFVELCLKNDLTIGGTIFPITKDMHKVTYTD